MKKLTISLLIMLIASMLINSLRACPTCVGRLELDTPAFFTREYDESYQTNHGDDDDDDHDDEETNHTKRWR